ncbi:MAG: alpha/beta hydrolase [Opitutales bacterium]
MGALGGASDGEPPVAAEQWWHAIEENAQVEAWFLPLPSKEPAAPRPTVIFFHGNATLIEQCMPLVQAYHAQGFNVLLPEYRGYGRSGGNPSKANIRRDMRAFHERLLADPRVDPEKIVLHGQSVGAAVALDLARETEPFAVILNSPFRSMAAMLWKFGIPPVFVADAYDNAAAIQETTMPVLITHGQQDRTIPFAHGQALSESRAGLQLFGYEGDHNVQTMAEWARIRAREAAFLRELGLIEVEAEGTDGAR